jgi:hypothetical protein
MSPVRNDGDAKEISQRQDKFVPRSAARATALPQKNIEARTAALRFAET